MTPTPVVIASSGYQINTNHMKLGKYSIGVGDRFTHQGKAQLRAIMKANEKGLYITPVWNKSNREHIYVGTEPADTRKEADEAVQALKYEGKYFVDADHINLNTVAKYVAVSDFFTLDVASFIGKECSKEAVEAFVASCRKYLGELQIPGMNQPLHVTEALLQRIASQFLAATQHASEIYAYLKKEKGEGHFITEVSMDEVESPQTPVELLFILKMLADKGVPVQTIAPKFTGRFNKGVDYVGDVCQFEQEFSDDIAVITHAARQYGLPENLKLSVHSGSDKFSIYAPIRRVLQRTGAGLHIKTAGTTWLEEVIGLAEAGGKGLDLARSIYTEALEHLEELCAPYATVIDIRAERLPTAQEVARWTSDQFTSALRHDPTNPRFNPDLRQLLHVGYKIAAKKGDQYLSALREFHPVISKAVTGNLFTRHIHPLFLKDAQDQSAPSP